MKPIVNIVPVSGGKDSTACLLIALNSARRVIPIFNDTGWEHPITYEYLEYLERHLKITIYRTKGKPGTSNLIELIRARKRFPFGLGRFCTTYLKQYALKDFFVRTVYSDEENFEFFFGMRTDESVQRAKHYEGITPEDLLEIDDIFPSRYPKKYHHAIKVRLPIVDWKTIDVFKFLESEGVEANPLYKEGTNDRVGCYPCMLAGKKAQKLMFSTEVGKERLKIIRSLEKELNITYEMYDTSEICELCNI